ncbi:transporter [Actinomadura darangshiensis]|uniref:Transporter n=1 Tax=Actinomadura darangshiensis TaxID=705336 RepID=A0A4R5ART9_9ACTN|nr:ABC transporter permease subunit [Actinomadura darangshiensis]TDD75661.1 transporter [Actinomadura darangshiensis]
MIWLTWRQHRKQMLAALIGLAVLLAVLIPTGLKMHHAFTDMGTERCLNGLGDGSLVGAGKVSECQSVVDRFQRAYGDYGRAALLLIFVPLLAGLFWGAPLVAREIESGTHRLVWTQGVTRARWGAVKIAAITVAALLFAIGYAALVSWWMGPLNRTGTSRLEFLSFDVQGIAPIGYTLFAVALGIFAGTVTRKVMPAMAMTLVGFVVLRIPLAVLGRPNFQGAKDLKYPVVSDTAPNIGNGNWVISDGVYDRAGSLLAGDTQAVCWPPPDSPDADGCYGAGAYNLVSYQPGDRFWPFQYLETGVYVLLAAGLLYLAIRRLQRQMT